MNPNRIDADTVSSLKTNKETAKKTTSTLPIPANAANQGKPSRMVVSIAISFWALIIFGTLAGLLTTVGNAKSDRKNAASIRQEAYQALLPVIDIVDEVDAPNREEALLGALKTINEKVLTIDPKHPMAIQTKDEIQSELDDIKAARIDLHEQTISEQVKNLDESKSQIDQLLAQVQQLESAHAALKATNNELKSANLTLTSQKLSLNTEKDQLASAKRALENSIRESESNNNKLESTNNWYQDEYKKLKSSNSWYCSTNKKLESTNKWLSGEKSKLAREVSSLKSKLSCAYSDYAKRLRSKDCEISSLKRQIAALKKAQYATFRQSR